MRLLLDENFPVDFASYLSGYDVLTVLGLGWSGIRNGELLRRAASVCDVFVTLDRSLPFQQNIKALEVAVVALRSRSNRVADLVLHVDELLEAVARAKRGQVEVAGGL